MSTENYRKIIVLESQSHEPVTVEAMVYPTKLLLKDGRELVFPIQDNMIGDILFAYYDGIQLTAIPRKELFASPLSPVETIAGNIDEKLHLIQDLVAKMQKGDIVGVIESIGQAAQDAFSVMLTKKDMFFDVEFPKATVHAYLDCGSEICCIDPSIAKKIGAIPTASISINGATGSQSVPLFLMDFSIKDRKFQSVECAIIPLQSKGYDMLLSDKFLELVN
jgi:hypothetical protein